MDKKLTPYQEEMLMRCLAGEIPTSQYFKSLGMHTGNPRYIHENGYSRLKPSMMEDFDGYTLLMTFDQGLYSVLPEHKSRVSTRKGLTFTGIAGLKVVKDNETGVEYYYAIILDT